MKKFAVIFLAAIMLVFCACKGKDLAYEYKSDETNFVIITVFSTDQSIILDNFKVAFRENATVADCTIFALQSCGIHYELAGAGKSSYMKEIDHLAEFGEGPESGWLYRVNGSFDSAGTSMGAFKVSANDVIEWVYTTDLGVSEGADESE